VAGVESDADRAVFVDPDGHGEVITYRKRNGQAVTFDAVFDNEFVQIDAGDFAGVGSSDPVLTCRSADLPAGAGEGDRVEIVGVVYKVAGAIEADGTGMSIVRLRRD
jgi:hypothetical protein